MIMRVDFPENHYIRHELYKANVRNLYRVYLSMLFNPEGAKKDQP